MYVSSRIGWVNEETIAITRMAWCRGHCQKWNRCHQNRISIDYDGAPLRRSLSSQVIVHEMHSETDMLIFGENKKSRDPRCDDFCSQKKANLWYSRKKLRRYNTSYYRNWHMFLSSTNFINKLLKAFLSEFTYVNIVREFIFLTETTLINYLWISKYLLRSCIRYCYLIWLILITHSLPVRVQMSQLIPIRQYQWRPWRRWRW